VSENLCIVSNCVVGIIVLVDLLEPGGEADFMRLFERLDYALWGLLLCMLRGVWANTLMRRFLNTGYRAVR